MTIIPNSKLYSFEKYIDKYGYLLYTNVGASMLPFLREKRDIIEIRPKHGRIKKYEVALYKKGNMYILHRCIQSSPLEYVFAGDNNTFKEYGVRDEDILGVMTRVVRNGRTIYPNNPLYKLYYHLWVDFFPVKVFIIKCKVLLRVFVKKGRGKRRNT